MNHQPDYRMSTVGWGGGCGNHPGRGGGGVGAGGAPPTGGVVGLATLDPPYG
jgi:hypothetical protein